jgi:spore germination protein KB
MSAPPPIRHAREEGRINTSQFAWMLLAIFTSATGTAVPHLLLETARRDGWIAVLVAGGMDGAISLIYAYMGLRFPGETFVEYASTILGPWLGKPVGLMHPLFFFLVGATQLRAIADLMGTIFLRGTPLAVIGLVCILTAAYAARHGLEVTARTAMVLGPVFVLSAALIVLLVAPRVHAEQLQPVLENGLGPVLQGVPLTLSYIAICVMMGMFQAYQHKPRQAWIAKFSSLAAGAVMLSGIMLLAVTVIGADVAKESRYPDLEVARMISMFDFVERMEAFWVVVSMGSSILALALLLWASALGLAQTFGLREYRPLVFPLAFLMLPLSLVLFESAAQRTEFIRSSFPLYALLVEGGLEILLWLAALLLGRRGIAGGSRAES